MHVEFSGLELAAGAGDGVFGAGVAARVDVRALLRDTVLKVCLFVCLFVVVVRGIC
jgi:hypothetical protein